MNEESFNISIRKFLKMLMLKLSSFIGGSRVAKATVDGPRVGTIGAPRHRTDHELRTGFARHSRSSTRAASAKASAAGALRAAHRERAPAGFASSGALQPDGPPRRAWSATFCDMLLPISAHVCGVGENRFRCQRDQPADRLSRRVAARRVAAAKRSCCARRGASSFHAGPGRGQRQSGRARERRASRSDRRSTPDDGVGKRLPDRRLGHHILRIAGGLRCRAARAAGHLRPDRKEARDAGSLFPEPISPTPWSSSTRRATNARRPMAAC